MRAISWIWTLATARDAWQRDPKLRTWIGQLSLHGHYIENHLSVHSSPYNHIIGEATALYLLGIAFEGAPDAERWRSKGRTLLRDFGPQQFYRDGFCVEQAVGYHYYTLGFLTLAMLAGRATGDDQLQLEGLIRKGYSAGAAMRQPDGTWPAIGDVDSARSVPIAHNNFWDFASLHRLAAVALNEPALAFGGDRFSEETYWMLGAAGIARGKAMEGTVPPNQVTVLPHAGYYTARQQDDWMLLDCGPIAGGLHRDGTPSTAHGHADTLQLLVHWGGRAVLRDTGMSNYAGNAKRMDHFRSPAAHNTVWLEGAPLVRPAGRLGWAHNVSSTSLRWVDDPEYWRACGEVTWGKCTIRRQVFAIPDEAVWIADWLDSDVPRTAHWAWQLVDSAWVMVEQSQRRVELSCGTFGMQCIATVDALGCEMIVPDREGCEGWYCPGYGELATGRAARLRLPLTSSALVLTVLGAPRRTVIFSKDGQELRLPFETSYPAPDGGPKDLKECCYDSLGGGIWRLGV